jgi:hypothetical protein
MSEFWNFALDFAEFLRTSRSVEAGREFLAEHWQRQTDQSHSSRSTCSHPWQLKESRQRRHIGQASLALIVELNEDRCGAVLLTRGRIAWR